jgi:class 3 adenylate cyclase
MAGPIPSLVAIVTLMIATTRPTHSYDLTLGLLMPAKFRKIAEFAINQVNNEVFKDVNIKAGFRWKDFKCDDILPIGITSEFNYIYNSTNPQVDAYIGPVDIVTRSCSSSCESASYLSASFGKAMLSPACQEMKRNFGSGKDMNNVFVRTAYLPIDFSEKGEDVQCGNLPLSITNFNKLMDLFEWRYITVIVSTTYYNSAKQLQNTLKKCTRDKDTEKIIEVQKYNSTSFASTNSTDNFNNAMDQYLSNKNARIFFLHGSDEDNARILVKAFKKKMFNGTWGFVTTEFNMGKVKEWHKKKVDWMKDDATKQMLNLKEVFNGFIDFSTPSVNMKKFEQKLPNQKVTEKDAYLVDAIELYARSFKEAYQANPGDYLSKTGNGNLSRLMDRMTNTNFQGASGNVKINKNTKDRGFDSYEIKYFSNGQIEEECTEPLFRDLNNTAIKECDKFAWPGDGKKPSDTPKCGFRGELCQQMEVLTIVFIVIAFILISLTIAAFVLYKRNKYGNNDLVSKGFIIDAEVIAKMMNTKKESEQNNPNQFEQNGKAGGSIGKGSIGSRSPMLQEQGNGMELVKKGDAEKMKDDNISIVSNTDSIRERNLNVFKHNDQIVMVKKLQRSSVNISRDKDIKMEFKNVRDIHDQNLCAVVAVCLQSPQVSILEQYCSKGGLMDVLQDDTVDLDMMFKMSFASDIAHGMTELHRHGIVHGRLTSSNCVIDNRWVCKITDYGMHKFREEHYTTIQESNDITEQQKNKDLLWKAPELLASNTKKPTKESDVYSYGIILSEIVTREDPYASHNMETKDIAEQVKMGTEPPMRPNIPEPGPTECEELHLIFKEMKKCWDQAPNRRPTFDSLRTTLKPKGSMMDNMIMRLEKYTNDLEEKVSERNDQLKGEKAKNDELLYKMLPVPVAIALQNGKEIPPICFECATIFFSDIVGFTSLASESTPMQVVAMLNDLYSCFDTCTDSYDCYKVETIGDAYMVVSGLPTTNGDKHAGQIATLSLDLLHAIKSFRIRHRPEILMQLRIGIHSGPCVAGVVGLKMPRYCLFGDTVNYASRMESSGLALRVHVSPECKEVLDRLGQQDPPEIYHLVDRGLVNMKGKGQIHTYFLTGREGFTKSLPDLSLAAGLDAHDFK